MTIYQFAQECYFRNLTAEEAALLSISAGHPIAKRIITDIYVEIGLAIKDQSATPINITES